MNKELKAHIDAMNDDEQYSYSISLRFVERLIDVFGIGIIFIACLFPNILVILLVVAIAFFTAKIGALLKQARQYIEEKLGLE